MKLAAVSVIVAAAIAFGGLCSSIAYAGHSESGHGNRYARESAHDYGAAGFFTPHRIGVIRDYYSGRGAGGLPPGLQKHLERTGHLPPGLEGRPLPPGLQGHLAVGQTLPPDILRELTLAPRDLLSQLGPLPPQSRLYFYNGNAILLDPKTSAVLDIVRDVLTLSGR